MIANGRCARRLAEIGLGGIHIHTSAAGGRSAPSPPEQVMASSHLPARSPGRSTASALFITSSPIGRQKRHSFAKSAIQVLSINYAFILSAHGNGNLSDCRSSTAVVAAAIRHYWTGTSYLKPVAVWQRHGTSSSYDFHIN